MRQTNMADYDDKLLKGLNKLDGCRERTGSELSRLFDLTWEWEMSRYPEYATVVGLPYKGREGGLAWSERTPEAITEGKRLLHEIRQCAEGFSAHPDDENFDAGNAAKELSEVDAFNLKLFTHDLDAELAGHRFPSELLALDQMDGPQQLVPRILMQMPTASTEDLENIIDRIGKTERYVDQVIVLLERGIEANVTAPRITVLPVPGHIENLLSADLPKSPLMRPFSNAKGALVEKAEQALASTAYPAFRRLKKYLETRYIPSARKTTALSALPDGEAWYAHKVKVMTTTDMSPAQIHELGLEEVARITAQIKEVMKSAGHQGSLASYLDKLNADPAAFFKKPSELIAAYRDIAKRADAASVRFFGRLPRLPYGVEPVPTFAEKNMPAAYYERGTLEGGRPGNFFANTHALETRPRWEMEAVLLHEAVPGHHLQLALAQEMEDVPQFRKHGGYTAYIEGWALYAEKLGIEMGFYQTPESQIGRLGLELWRAVRLVLDTGLHALGWSREKAMRYFSETTGKDNQEIEVEVDRYIALPAQALSYKLGEQAILRLRSQAEELARAKGLELDRRAFHDNVLGSGALPLTVLEEVVNAWADSAYR